MDGTGIDKLGPRTGAFVRSPWGSATVGVWVLYAGYGLWVLQQPDAEARSVQWLALAFGTACIVVFVWAAVRLAWASSGRLRTAWLLMAAGQATLEMADIVYTALGYPGVSSADALYVATYPLMLAGVLMLPFTAISPRDRLVLVLDRALVLAAGATFIWYEMAPTLGNWAALSQEARLNLVYPPLELVLLAAAVTLIQRDVTGVNRITLTCLALGFASGVSSSLIDLSAIVTGAGPLQVVWLAVSALSYALFATGPAWQLGGGQRPDGPRISSARRVLRDALPYFAAAASMLVFALAVARRGSPAQAGGVLVGAAFTTALLLCRQYVVLRENVRLYEELDAAHAELERRNAALSEHMRLQAEVERLSRHDLKTPLTGIIGIPQILREIPGLSARHEQLLRTVERSGYRLLGMINLSLDLFRMEQGRYRFEPTAVDLVDVVRRVASDLARVAGSRGVELRVQPGSPEAPVYAWAEDLLSYSMFANLVKNAVEASPEGGAVTVSFHQHADEVRIRIHNEGAVPEPLRERFFEKYTTAGKPDGTGLGTYSARLMAETQCGRIRVLTGEADTTVEVVLPTPPDAASNPEDRAPGAAAEPGPQEPVALGALRVLVVDDDRVGREVLRAALPSPPLVVETAVDGADAIGKLDGFRPDVVFMDLEMPSMDGLEATARLRAREAGAGYRAFVVGVSAHDDPETRRRFREAGCDRYLVRPTEPDEVLAALHEASARLAARKAR